MDRTPVQNAARLVGIVFLLVGIGGFSITTNLYEGLEFAGDDGTAELLGHLPGERLQHRAGSSARRTRPCRDRERRGRSDRRRRDLRRLFALGIIGGGDWIPVNDADNWLHSAPG